MSESESDALPLGDAPIFLHHNYISIFVLNLQDIKLFLYLYIFMFIYIKEAIMLSNYILTHLHSTIVECK